jgi:predicted ATPase
MLTRVYVDNFKCFVNFEYRPARKQLIFGPNGTGKSSLFEAVLFLRQFVIRGDKAEDIFMSFHRTRWLQQHRQTFELEATLERDSYVYKLVLDPWGEPPKPKVVSETLQLNGKPIFEFLEGEVHLYNDRLEHKVTYDFDWHRSALATIVSRKDNVKLTNFKIWLRGLLCFKLNPFAMGATAETEDPWPNVNLGNFAAWYRHLAQEHRQEDNNLLKSLSEAIDGFSFLKTTPVGENARMLLAEFSQQSGPSVNFSFAELSDGQKCLICLYAILHFVISKGSTVILDEPDNFVALREIQPWLMNVLDMIEDRHGQILIISHHPELINQMAVLQGLEFLRDATGPVRVQEFKSDSPLTPAELVARGWERE